MDETSSHVFVIMLAIVVTFGATIAMAKLKKKKK